MANPLPKPDQRPSPDALLEAARREEERVGKLRIFVGAAPGVGKTYEMLQNARARAKDGYDVVIGVVETHGRKETEALLEGLEMVPCQRIEYKGQLLAEMDLDAIITRRVPMVEIDPVLFEQVLFNLSDNAAKYAPAGTTVRIRSWRDRDLIGLQVLDQGGGILPGDLEQIFDKFYRARKVDRVRAGTGLGLAISRGFIEAMHGTISAANRTDHTGAVFTIRLPVPTHAKRLDTAV